MATNLVSIHADPFNRLQILSKMDGRPMSQIASEAITDYWLKRQKALVDKEAINYAIKALALEDAVKRRMAEVRRETLEMRGDDLAPTSEDDGPPRPRPPYPPDEPQSREDA